jgi:membrane protease YdiL (CAAX protease family)
MEPLMPGPALIDVVFTVLLIVVASVVEYLYFWPRFRAEAAADRPGARLRAYRRFVIALWGFALAALAIWRVHSRPWSVLGFGTSHGWRAVVGLTIGVAGVALVILQLWSVMRLPQKRRVAARPKLGTLGFMLPRSRGELSWFLIVSATAGFCEELLYRGYLAWFFARWLGAVGAMTLAVLIFGISHIYQGRGGAVKATIAGAVMAAIVLACGSLIPAMMLHALIDASGGIVGYLLLHDYPAVGPELTANGARAATS